MTPIALNEACARKLGWHDKPFRGYVRPNIPDYCHSIEAAWEIVEKFPTWTMWRDEQGFHLYVWKSKTDMLNQRESAAINADTAPMAIVLAFLKMEESK